jgi:Fe-S-cluster containining protein
MDDFPKQSLKFDCVRCGNCCRLEAGDLFLSATDLRRLSEYLELSDEEFFLEYCEIVDLGLAKRVSLIAEDSGACVFLGENGCEVYEQRPLQCRTFPFWATNLMDESSYCALSESCPGVNQGKAWSPQEIAELIAETQREPLLDVGD